MQPPWKRWLTRTAKVVLAIAVLYFVGARFRDDLKDASLSDMEIRPGWLIASGGLYLVSMIPNAWYWGHLLHRFGHPLAGYASIRAHYIGQLGKYVPGKAFAILIRAGLVRPLGVPLTASVVASFYEVLTGMTAGALVAAFIYAFDPPTLTALPSAGADIEWHPLWLGMLLAGACGIPLLPGVFNFVIARLTARIQRIEHTALPAIMPPTLALGLVVTSCGWFVQGLSVWALLQAVVQDAPPFSWSIWTECTAGIAFATVVGFAFFIMPGGLGVREELLKDVLRAVGPLDQIALAVLLLRLVWIAFESMFAACTFWLDPASAQQKQSLSCTGLSNR